MADSYVVTGARGGSVTIAVQGIQLALQFFGAALLSRLLEPSDFGLVALVAIFLAVGNLIRDFGMPTAALQSKFLSLQQASNLFWVNVALGLSAGSLLGAATPLLVSIYHEPRLGRIVPVMALTLVLNSIQAQYWVHLSRNLRFTALAMSGAGSQLFGLFVALGGALGGWGYWALVAQPLSAAVCQLSIRAVLTRWIPMRPRRGYGVAAIIRAGGSIGGAQLVSALADNSDSAAIGLQWGAGPLGFYNRAFQILTVPVQGMLGPLTQVVIPTVNAAVASGRKASDVLLRVQFALGAVIVWVFLVTSATADALLPAVLGSQWGPSVPIFRILAIGGAAWAFSFVSYWLFVVEFQSRQLLYYNLAMKTSTIVIVACASFLGVQAVAWAYAACLVVSWPVGLVWLHRCAGLDSASYLRNGLRVLGAGGAAYGAAALLDVFVVSEIGRWGKPALSGLAATVVYIGVLLLVPGGCREVASAVRLGRTVLSGE